MPKGRNLVRIDSTQSYLLPGEAGEVASKAPW